MDRVVITPNRCCPCPLWVISCSAKRHVRFTPNSDRKSGHQFRVMSALPPKADMCSALADVCFGPKADIPTKHRIVVFEPVVARNNRFLLMDADCSNYLQPLGLAWRLAGSRKLGPKRSCFPAKSFHLSCRRGSKHRSVNPILVAPEQ
jgi:hypothetical protein